MNYTFYCFFYVALVIGFERSNYIFVEPDTFLPIMDVLLVKENNRTTERTFTVVINVVDPSITNINPATIIDDYRISFVGDPRTQRLSFPTTDQTIEFSFFLFPDIFPEGLEGFQAMSSPSQPEENETPVLYTTPNNEADVFVSTIIVIRDNDCK